VPYRDSKLTRLLQVSAPDCAPVPLIATDCTRVPPTAT
jgi:hypothetical protein